MTPRHILVPLDFSRQSEQALDYAITLAHLFQTRLTLLHVVYAAMFGARHPTHASAMVAHVARVKTDAQQALASIAERVQDMGIACDMEIVDGTPFQTICNRAQERRIDLIVMGSHGQSGLPPALLGSVAERVVRLAPCPVLVVKGTNVYLDI